MSGPGWCDIRNSGAYPLDHFQVEPGQGGELPGRAQQAHLADAQVAQDLRAGSDGQVVAGARAGDALFVSKHQLAQAMGCERRYLAEQEEPFAWSVPLARGTITHKAIDRAAVQYSTEE